MESIPNHLVNETSPYLIQHAYNPIDWYPWGEEALDKAQRLNRPIFLSIGYSACHWCHVMAHETFEDPQIAAFLNENFVSIKVDREERPDLDEIYMTAVVSMNGQGGWPMSVFLTPDGKPFYGGTYFPPTRSNGMPSFSEVIISILRAWQDNRTEIYNSADKLALHLVSTMEWNLDGATAVPISALNKAAETLMKTYDWDFGGWGNAPKFPAPMSIEFLLLQATRGNQNALKAADHALSALNRGGIFDVTGGGFHRYSTDNLWLVPHFEKMLYDNAQLAEVFLHGYLVTKNIGYRSTCEETLDFVLREMTDPLGGFYSSLDADSEGEEGKYYLWAIPEIKDALNESGDFDYFMRVYNPPAQGNFEGKIILQRSGNDEELARELQLSEEAFRTKLKQCHEILRKYRNGRVRPAADNKILVFWNAMMISALAQAARYLDRQDYLEAARKNATFLLAELHPGDRLLRSWRESQSKQNAFLEDYGALELALLELYQSDPDPHWFNAAVQLAKEMVKNFGDDSGGFYNTRHDQEGLIVRPRDLQDNATPSGNALAAFALLTLSAYTENVEWRSRAEKLIAGIQKVALKYPSAFAFWLQAIDFSFGVVDQIALVWPAGNKAYIEYLDHIWSTYRARTVVAFSEYPPLETAPALLQDRPFRNNTATVYLCQGFVCKMPITSLQELKEKLPPA
ncbi:MAG: thioredoxin domain-containing protein [Anaerolineaceae bacterium]|nr:thioredoxin domain-containing protein [Anaerolineaceae bacterium]